MTRAIPGLTPAGFPGIQEAMGCIRPTLALVSALVFAAGARAGDTFVEGFTGGSNTGGWTFGSPGGSIPGSGGNPGAYLASGLLDTFAPMPRTSLTGSVFTGDFREKKVTGLGVDLITFSALSTGGRPLTLMLMHDNGTPGNPGDDTAAYFLGPNIPHVGLGWLSYDYPVPASETLLPPGWQLLNMGDVGSPANHSWDQVIQAVTRVQFFYGDPTFVFIFQQWFLGLDNARITTLACAATAGAVPDGHDVPGAMLTIQKAPGGNIRLRWAPSCNACDSDYGVYEGAIGTWYSHALKFCTTGGLEVKTLAPAAGDAYYLVVPHNGANEGSYGRDSDENERPPGTATCHLQAFQPCE